MIIVKESAPHIRRKDSAWMMMTDVLIALLPTLIFAIVIFPFNTLINLLITSSIMVFSEFVFIGLTKMMPKDGLKHTFKERFLYAYKGRYHLIHVTAPLVSAFILTLITPSGAPFYAVAVGAFIGIVFGKLVFGGTGNNIFNPAAVGMMVSKLAFGNKYNVYLPLPERFNGTSTSLGGTVLGNVSQNGFESIYDVSFFDMFIGKMGGTLGEVYTITILIGLIYLLVRRTIDFRVVISYFATFTFMIFTAGLCINSILPSVKFYDFMLFELLSGGVIFGGVFMITDPVAAPITRPGRIIYAMVAAVIVVLIRLFGSLPEGVAIAILVADMFSPVIDYHKWSNVNYSWKNILAMGLVVVIPTIIMVISLMFGGVVK